MNKHFPNLDELFGGYFHQDWREDAATAMGIVETYLSEWPAAEVAMAADELRALLATSTDEELAYALKSLGSFYDPGLDEIGYRGWLEKVLEKLQRDRRSIPS